MDSAQPNIALVVLDTLQKDIFDRKFNWISGVNYNNAWSTTHYSPAAHGSLFTGKFGSEIGVHGKSPNLDCEQPTLAEILRDSGYTTRGFSANTYVSKYFDFDRGFKTFQNETRVVSGEASSFNWPQFIKDHKT
ncbi:sulfatase-like hydrolase/transferase [Halorubrum saccharovorum]|uniref:sulfatase-like hydrolase/transferase n=1 Tax=Halorubrum saccharovorum TaxID=2248 RepID=UPI00190FE26E|nr:sulfatase-like hydrolase/transferase [Halorubrum saccharovorum]